MGLTKGQEACINTLDRSIVVAAGAGSGKTFTLTRRIVHAIESGQVDDIDRVCAITFTTKAAGELRSRIKQALRACGRNDQALKVDEAWVSTIHGMCARILRAHAVELGIDPGFEMLGDGEGELLRARAIDCALKGNRMTGEEASRDEEWGLAVEALFDEYSSQSVESMIGALMVKAGSSPLGFDSFEVSHDRANVAYLADEALSAIEVVIEQAQAQKPTEKRGQWIAKAQDAVSHVRSGLQNGHADDAKWCLCSLDAVPMPAKQGSDEYKEQVTQAVDTFVTCAMELRLAAAIPHLDTLLRLSRVAFGFYGEEKRRYGVLDNDDLLVMAFRAIDGNPAIAARYCDKFQLVMIDEFQDTDQMQVDMIKKLAGPNACRLCTVGDAQQSIYRFRGADVSVYRRHLSGVQAGNPEDVIQFPDNFRSHSDVLSLVDRVFEKPDMFGGEFMSLKHGRDESKVKHPFAEGVPRVQVQLTTTPYRVASELKRDLAADRVAQAFADLREKGHSAGEMAILLGRMKYAGIYADALRKRGLACVIAGGSVFADSAEAKLVSDLASMAANPHQTQALHNVLTSPLFSLTAGDLLKLATNVDEESGRVKRCDLQAGFASCARMLREEGVQSGWSVRLTLALRVLSQFFEGVGGIPLSQLVMDVMVDSGLLTRLESCGAEGMAQAGNIYKAVRMVESLERSGSSGPAQVAAGYKELLDKTKEAPGALSVSGGDFVRIMTVHASKGLQFPIVAVAEFRDRSSAASGLIMGSVEGKTFVSLDLGDTAKSLDGSLKKCSLSSMIPLMVEDAADEDDLAKVIVNSGGLLELRAALTARDKLGESEEAKRLLYVALTRAEEALIVSMKGDRTSGNPFGTPKSCMQSLVPALTGSYDGFEAGISRLEFGGSMPALVEHVSLEGCEEGPVGETGEADAKMFIPVDEGRLRLDRVLVSPSRGGVFSYSSISDASHEGDALERLARRAFVSADKSDSSDDLPMGEGSPGQGGGADGLFAGFDTLFSSDEDDVLPSSSGSLLFDSDRATDLGTAFHRLAQYAVETRVAAGDLVAPPAERVESLARMGGLDEIQRLRLARAMDRWFGSDVADEMAAYQSLSAEVPFFVPIVRDGQSPVFLEGEIDLLALDESGKVATVVDYKTGGRADESEEALREKHVLQAACYAYSIMRQGISQVNAVFVRVERARAGASDQPQCVRYRFESDDLALLESVISQVYSASFDA